MPPYLEKIYLDTCIIIAWMKNETRSNREMEGVEYCIEKIMKNKIKAIASITIIGEILPALYSPRVYGLFERALLKRRNFELIAIDGRIITLTQEIRNFYCPQNKGIEFADATHLATGIHLAVDAFYTFDDKLLGIDGNVAGHDLSICKPPLPTQGRLPF